MEIVLRTFFVVDKPSASKRNSANISILARKKNVKETAGRNSSQKF